MANLGHGNDEMDGMDGRSAHINMGRSDPAIMARTNGSASDPSGPNEPLTT